MKKILIAILVLGCSSSAPGQVDPRYEKRADTVELSNSLSYYKDERTQLCYAGAYGGFNGSIFTHVPCLGEIERTAYRFRSK